MKYIGKSDEVATLHKLKKVLREERGEDDDGRLEMEKKATMEQKMANMRRG